jgi:hypothetical protein
LLLFGAFKTYFTYVPMIRSAKGQADDVAEQLVDMVDTYMGLLRPCLSEVSLPQPLLGSSKSSTQMPLKSIGISGPNASRT